ncbi:hypothetical protein [Pseudomonas thivervalensis]|uniref:hypothetical protein n=1 Tax=Pseudomonas thivervalensis TaxID=86265 RepID=UPI000A890C6E|nr:hypothetical protein [Pseudomonas thivervalensis]
MNREELAETFPDDIKIQEKRSRLTREALADVDAGRVIDHQAVQVWVESLGLE